ncbi:MAG TPA: 3-oxosteroid 1-dehydrogenase [Pseudonocardia sp.]|jgi:3-oxosteroid 1-dehydrogenase|uniref:3-oxosteroid 1-dehydrogenase n=1 Tax=Pseudonocardia sp. TaxID=60912 RepID=UPI002CA0FE81|nr:3-oxosteroid 1-dehydrogenase [Pseudonocardia sp.]HTF52627.1 3-oxosteroid 1-dehydrogenase [Pseudonocardia sp.]
MRECDVVVVGSGAAGMTAALTAAHRGLAVIVVEKASHFGGSTARSGGGLWIPNNSVLRRAGVADTPQAAASYLTHLLGDSVPEPRRRALLGHGPAMLDLVRRLTPLEFAWVPGYADYYPELPGGMPEGRTIEPKPLDGHVLGDELRRLNPAYISSPGGLTITAADYRWLNLVARHPRGVLKVGRVLGRRVLGALRRQHTLVMGQALAAGLRAGLQARDVPVWLDTPLLELCRDGERITGVRVRQGRTEEELRARRGVVLACGGFEHNAAMRERYQRAPIGTAWTTGAAENTGDGIEAGLAAGAAVDLMDDAWWGPSIPLSGGPYFCLSERTLPGCILVNAAGERFVNEAAPYVDAVHAMYDGHASGVSHVPSWLIADQRYRKRYTFAGLRPGQKFPGRWYKAGAVHTAATLDELASAIGVPAEGLRSTVNAFNTAARAGRDERFGRGDSAYDRYYGDPTIKPNPCLAPLEVAPFHAVRIVPGDLGTKGGLCVDERSRVLREDGTVIPGLYAAGNVSASVMGHTYAGAGATIGPAMTGGYLAALDLAASVSDAATLPEAARGEPTRGGAA